jgi:hypothetical protein
MRMDVSTWAQASVDGQSRENTLNYAGAGRDLRETQGMRAEIPCLLEDVSHILKNPHAQADPHVAGDGLSIYFVRPRYYCPIIRFQLRVRNGSFYDESALFIPCCGHLILFCLPCAAMALFRPDGARGLQPQTPCCLWLNTLTQVILLLHF